jgi:hypothetical protein
MIVSASRRTDLPAYYPDWLMGRIAAGYCLVRNPYNAKSLRRVSLEPEDLDLLVLWTRDPRPIMPRLRELDERGLRYYFQVTITGYPPAMEALAPPLGDSICALCELADRVGPGRALWRYDPVILSRDLDADRHRAVFGEIAARLEGRTERVTLSIVDEYAGTRSRLGRAGFPDASFREADYLPLLADLAGIAKARGMRPLACAEKVDLAPLGIEAGACVDSEPAASQRGASAERRDPGQRGACRCAPSVDIGAYGTCPRGCAYCYANRGAGRLVARGPEDEAL